jgi:hypothetical protein
MGIKFMGDEEQLRKERFDIMTNDASYIQNQCNHKKPNTTPAIGGQRMEDGSYIFLCLICNKQWNHETLPIELRIPMQYVGGFETEKTIVVTIPGLYKAGVDMSGFGLPKDPENMDIDELEKVIEALGKEERGKIDEKEIWD